VEQCQEHKVIITEALGDRLTPPSDHVNRTVILEKLADCALMQASYHIAAKKFTQAGQKVFVYLFSLHFCENVLCLIIIWTYGSLK